MMAFTIHSCKVYDKHDITVEKAIESKTERIKIIAIDNRKYFLDSLYYKNDILYGHLLKSRKHPNVEIILPKESIREIQIYNRKRSINRTIMLFVGIGGIYAISFAIR